MDDLGEQDLMRLEGKGVGRIHYIATASGGLFY